MFYKEYRVANSLRAVGFFYLPFGLNGKGSRLMINHICIMKSLIIFHVAFILFWVIKDYVRISIRNKYINHGLSTTLLVAIIIVSTSGYVWSCGGIESLRSDQWASLSAWFVVLPFLRWNIHDSWLNHLRGKPSGYLGDGPKSAYLDRLLANIYDREGFEPVIVRMTALILSLIIASLIMLIPHL